jgi:hypothetical protein
VWPSTRGRGTWLSQWTGVFSPLESDMHTVQWFRMMLFRRPAAQWCLLRRYYHASLYVPPHLTLKSLHSYGLWLCCLIATVSNSCFRIRKSPAGFSNGGKMCCLWGPNWVYICSVEHFGLHFGPNVVPQMFSKFCHNAVAQMFSKFCHNAVPQMFSKFCHNAVPQMF